MDEVVWRYHYPEMMKVNGFASVYQVITQTVSAFSSEIVGSNAAKTQRRIVIISSNPRDDRDTIHASLALAYSTPHLPLHAFQCCFAHISLRLLMKEDKARVDFRVRTKWLPAKRSTAAKKVLTTKKDNTYHCAISNHGDRHSARKLLSYVESTYLLIKAAIAPRSER